MRSPVGTGTPGVTDVTKGACESSRMGPDPLLSTQRQTLRYEAEWELAVLALSEVMWWDALMRRLFSARPAGPMSVPVLWGWCGSWGPVWVSPLPSPPASPTEECRRQVAALQVRLGVMANNGLRNAFRATASPVLRQAPEALGMPSVVPPPLHFPPGGLPSAANQWLGRRLAVARARGSPRVGRSPADVDPRGPLLHQGVPEDDAKRGRGQAPHRLVCAGGAEGWTPPHRLAFVDREDGGAVRLRPAGEAA